MFLPLCMVLLLHRAIEGFVLQRLHQRQRKSFSTVSSNEDLLPGITAIDDANPELLGKLEKLRDKPYFRFYSIDILASCEYMPQELYECYTQTCEIYPEDEDKVSIFFRRKPLECTHSINLGP